jgi:hypothetical protein
MASRNNATGVVISPSPARLTIDPLEVLWCGKSLSKLTVAETRTWSEPTEMAEALRAWVDKSNPRKRGANIAMGMGLGYRLEGYFSFIVYSAVLSRMWYRA